MASAGDPAFCTIWILCCRPALTLPIFQGPNNLPFDVQLVDASGDDAGLFKTAR